MSDRSKADPVVSGAPYRVTSVDGRPPSDLDDFVSDDVVQVRVESGQQTVTIHGSTRRDGDSVILFEKDAAGTGKDVRTWDIHPADRHFEARERSMY